MHDHPSMSWVARWVCPIPALFCAGMVVSWFIFPHPDPAIQAQRLWPGSVVVGGIALAYAFYAWRGWASYRRYRSGR